MAKLSTDTDPGCPLMGLPAFKALTQPPDLAVGPQGEGGRVEGGRVEGGVQLGSQVWAPLGQGGLPCTAPQALLHQVTAALLRAWHMHWCEELDMDQMCHGHTYQ